MGFNLGAAITGALGGFLAGGPVGAVAGGVGGGIFGGGGSKPSATTFTQIPETEQGQLARSGLFELATGPLPPVPRRGVAGLEPLGKERELARTTAEELAKPVDIFSLPEVQGIVHEATVRGDLLANRLGRALQASGTITTSGGRDVLGRAVTDVQKSIASSLAPFAVEERARRTQMISILEGLGLTEEERRRATSQAGLDALFQQKISELNLETGFRKGALESIIGLQPAVQPTVQGQTPSTISEFAPLIGPLLGAILD